MSSRWNWSSLAKLGRLNSPESEGTLCGSSSLLNSISEIKLEMTRKTSQKRLTWPVFGVFFVFGNGIAAFETGNADWLLFVLELVDVDELFRSTVIPGVEVEDTRLGTGMVVRHRVAETVAVASADAFVQIRTRNVQLEPALSFLHNHGIQIRKTKDFVTFAN